MTDPKRLRADARRNRQRVLDAAESAFASLGVAVPLDEIARRAGVGAGTVYRHFPTKEALFHAIVLGRLERMTARARALADEPDPGAAFFGYLADLVDALTARRVEIGHPTAPVVQEFLAAVAELMARAQRAGAVRDDVGASELMALLRAISVVVGDAADGHHARRLVGILGDGLRPPR